MGGSLSEGLRTVFGIVLACLVIGFVFMNWSTIAESGSIALTQQNSIVTKMDEAPYTQYDAASITGSEVINVIKQHSTDDIFVGVDVGAGFVNYIHADSSLAAPGTDIRTAKVKTNPNYINPNAKFTGTVVRDATTGAILGLQFVKD